MSTINFSGIATGLDTASIISQLVAIRRRPIVRLEYRRTLLEAQRGALATLKTKLLDLQSATQALDTANEFAALTARSSVESLLTVTAGGDASPGSYDIVIHNLAEAQKDISQGYDSQYDSVGEGTVTFTVGGETIELTLRGFTSLEGLKNQINDNVPGINASLVYDGGDSGGYRLVLVGAEAGSESGFTADFSGLNGGIPPAMTTHTAAVDALLTIDGIEVQASGNTITDAISGLTLHLHGADSAQTVRVDVATDAAAIADKVGDLIDRYNDLFIFVNEQMADDGTLNGNSTLRMVASRIETMFSTALDGGAGDVNMFYQVGITRGDERLLTFDRQEFRDALRDDYGGVRDFFIQREGNTGKAYLIEQTISGMTDAYHGLFKISSDSITAKLDSIDDSITRYERSVDAYRTILERKFLAMERMVASLQAQGSYLSSLIIY